MERLPEVAGETTTPDPFLRDALRKLVASLPETARMVIVLRYGEDMDVADLDVEVRVRLPRRRRHRGGQRQELIAGLKGVYVRVYAFERDGAYTPADLQAVRDQLRGWKVIVSSHEKDEDVQILVRQDGDTTSGMVILSSEPKEITVVNIVGPIRPQDLKTLGGQFGIPKIEDKKKE